jgi:hypothetical protein
MKRQSPRQSCSKKKVNLEGMAAVVDMWVQSSEEREEKRQGEVSGSSGSSTG